MFHNGGYTIKIIILLLCHLLTLSAIADTLAGKVIKVTDGDTVHVMRDNHTKEIVRLAGIDAPERTQAHGKKAASYLASLVSEQSVSVEFSKRDRYGRIVGKIIINGLDANLAMVQAGYAWHYKAYEREQSKGDKLIYALAEGNARARGAGLFQDMDPVEPWRWRKDQRNLRRVKPVIKQRSTSAANSSMLVWVNLNSRKYHCPGTKYYGNTKLGKMITESEAIESGFSGAHGLACN